MNKRFSTTFKIHFTAAGKRKTVGGVAYAVYPSVLLVEGVHHGLIGGPTMYPTTVLANSAPMWNNIPVTLNHPQDEAGAYVSASSPAVLTAWAIGKLLNGRFEDGKLKADVMLDVVKTNAKDAGLIAALDSGAEMELSTGLFGEEEAKVGVWNNEAYENELISISPDHLALLPNSTGACSWVDGCGIRANADQMDNGPKVNQSKEEYLLHKSLRLQKTAASHGNIHKQLREYVNSFDQKRTAETGPWKYCYIEEVYDNYFIWEEETKDGSKLWRQSYAINAEDQVIVSDDKTQVQKVITYTPISNNAKQEEHSMANKEVKPCCPDRVASLIANTATTYTADDADWLSQLNAEQLAKLETNATGESMPDCGADGKGPKGEMPCRKVAAAKANEGQDPPAATAQTFGAFMDSAPAEFRAVINAGMRALDAKRAELMIKIKANAKNTFTDEELKALPDAVLEKLGAVAAIDPTPAPSYAGMGGFVPNAGAETEEAYVPATFDFGKK
jgi:hypothetical protein